MKKTKNQKPKTLFLRNKMKKIAILTLSALFAVACGSAVQTTNTNITVQNSNESLIVSSHSGEANTAQNTMVVPKSETKSKWTQSGTPIDVSAYDAEIAKSEKDVKAKSDNAAKKKLAEFYIKRGVALTDARQYASALGDYRRALKYDPGNEEAKKWIDQIITIYDSINRESPPEGQEPPPLPFTKQGETKQTNSTEKINFTKGATSAIAAGNLTNYKDSKSFLVSVKQGQTLRTEQIKDDDSLDAVTVELADSTGKYVGDSDASCNNRKEINPTIAGDYRITVTECLKADVWNGQFKLKISVE